ncbi:TPA: hypothetical protein DEP21_02700, partial [Patescibacteria group bacterium]|nr:hypothetical protein [Candidatus Gracilibacteria bacterium]
PIATIVSPITLSLSPITLAIFIAQFTTHSHHKTSHTSHIIIKRIDFLRENFSVSITIACLDLIAERNIKTKKNHNNNNASYLSIVGVEEKRNQLFKK